MITKTRVRYKLAEVMKRYNIRFSDDALTAMVEAVTGERGSPDPLTTEGRRAMKAYADCLGFRPSFGVELADTFNALGAKTDDEIKKAFGVLRGDKWYVTNGRVPTVEALARYMLAARVKPETTSYNGELADYVRDLENR